MNILKETRLAKGLSLTRMAELIGIPISTYAMIESGECSAGKEVAHKVGVLLEVDPNIIFYLRDSPCVNMATTKPPRPKTLHKRGA